MYCGEGTHEDKGCRLFCVNALLLRDGSICTDCLGKTPWRGIVRRCYNQSAMASGAVANMVFQNRRRLTWDSVDAFIAPSEHGSGRND